MSLVRRYMRYEQDEPFDMTEILRTQFALDDSQYFSTVEVLPGDPDRDEHIVPVSIRADANRRHRYSFGAGYGTDTNVRGTLQWEDRRINTAGHRFNVELKGASKQQEPRVALHHPDRRSGAREARVRDHATSSASWPTSTRRSSSSSPASRSVSGPLAVGVLRDGHQHDHAIGRAGPDGYAAHSRHQRRLGAAGLSR